MYGVVVWSDRKDRKAVIWCEDHGDLAYYRGPGDDQLRPEPDLNVGDFVQFRVKDAGNIRLADAPRLIAEQQFSGLAESLCRAGEQVGAPAPKHREGAQIISFVARGARPQVA